VRPRDWSARAAIEAVAEMFEARPRRLELRQTPSGLRWDLYHDLGAAMQL